MAQDNEICHLQWSKHLQNIGQLFYNLYSNESLADVTISCREGTLNAHKLVLSSCSPYFTRLLKNISQHTHPVFIMHGISLENMKIILEFMYRGKVEIPSHSVDDLMTIAENLEVQGFSFLNEIKTSSKNGVSSYHNQDQENSSHSQPNEKKRKLDSDKLNETKEILNSSSLNDSQAIDRPQTRFKGMKRVPVGEVQSPESPELDSSRFIPKKKMAKQMKDEIKSNSMKIEGKEISLNGPFNSIANHSTPNRDTPTDILAITPVITLSEGDNVLDCDEPSTDTSPVDSEKTVEVHEIPKKDLKNYSCDFCSARFARISHLQRHRRMHTGEKPFHCKVCDKSFARQDKLKLHVRNQHSVDYKPKSEKKPPILIGSPLDSCDAQSSSMSSITQSIIQSVNDISNNSSSSMVQRHTIKVKRRGRPRTREIHFQHERRPRGRPRKIAPKMENNQENYDLATLPYGDFSYLTRELQQSYVEPSLYPGVSSPVVINSSALQNSDVTIAQVNDTSPPQKSTNSSDESANSVQIIPVTTPASNLLDSIRLIGECTIRPVT